MKNKNIKILLIMITFISLLFLTSCGAQGPHLPNEELGGIPYQYYKTYTYNNNTYAIYKVNEVDIELKESYVYYDIKHFYNSDAKTWTINYLEQYSYISYNLYQKEFSTDEMKELSNQIKDILYQYQETLNINFEIYDINEVVEKEFTIDNNHNGVIYIMNMYIPFSIENVDTYDNFIILVPVKTILCYGDTEELTMYFDNNTTLQINIHNFDKELNILK